MDLTEPGHSRAAGSPHGCLTEKKTLRYNGSTLRWPACYMYTSVCLIMHPPFIHEDTGMSIFP